MNRISSCSEEPHTILMRVTRYPECTDRAIGHWDVLAKCGRCQECTAIRSIDPEVKM